MSSLNRAEIIGFLGADPDTSSLPSGTMVANFSVATTEKWKDKDTGELNERTEWHRVAAFGRLAEIIGEYLRKGSQVYIAGSIRTDKWEDREGVTRYTTKIMARELVMLGGGGSGKKREERKETANRNSGKRQVVEDNGEPDFDDDIPF